MRVRGSVKEAKTAAPLSGVRIYGTIAGRPIFDASTDELGNFYYQDQRTQFNGESIRVYTEHADADYESQTAERILPRDELRVDFELSKKSDPSVPVSGSVRARHPRGPVKAANVTASVAGRDLFRVETDSDGRFRHNVDATLIGQTLTISVSHSAYKQRTHEALLPESGMLLDLDLETTPQGLRVRGFVKDAPTGKPLHGARIYGTIGDDAIFDTSTDEHGDFHYQDQQTHAGRSIAVRAEHAGYKGDLKDQLVGSGALTFAFELSPADLVTIPPLKGHHPHEAAQELSELGLRMGSVSRVPARDQPPDTVIETSPDAGLAVPRGSNVDLIAAGKRPDWKKILGAAIALGVVLIAVVAYLTWFMGVTVPPLTGHSIQEARQELSSLGLTVGRVTEVPTADQPPNTVISTSPAAGQKVPHGTQVSLTEAIPKQCATGTLRQILESTATAQCLLELAQDRFKQGRCDDGFELMRAAAEKGPGPAACQLAKWYDPNLPRPACFPKSDAWDAAKYYKDAVQALPNDCAAGREGLRRSLDDSRQRGDERAKVILQEFWP
jgi:hypothetical protein